MGSIEQIIEARKHNFMIECGQRAAAAKERALAQFQSKNSQHPVFRAVPVSVVAEPKLSISVDTTNAEKSKPSAINFTSKGANSVFNAKKSFETKEKEPPARVTVPIKGAKSVSDAKKSFEVKENERRTSLTPVSKTLNRALQPRGSESASPKDGGTVPNEARSQYAQRSVSVPADDRGSRGRLVGEIGQFGGSKGLAHRQPSPSPTRKTPPKVMPKPVKPKPVECQPSKPASSLSKTLSSWKKSRAVSAPLGASWGMLVYLV